MAKLHWLLLTSLALSACTLIHDCATCEQRYYQVIDSTTERPLADVEVHLVAYGTFPSVGHPGTYVQAEWDRKSGVDGIFSIPKELGARANVQRVEKQGYVRVDVPQMLSPNAGALQPPTRPSIIYLTPKNDVRITEISYFLELSRIAHGNIGKVPESSNTNILGTLALNYVLSKLRAQTDREREYIRKFCELGHDIADAPWPNQGPSYFYFKKNVTEFLTDCGFKKAEPKSPQ